RHDRPSLVHHPDQSDARPDGHADSARSGARGALGWQHGHARRQPDRRLHGNRRRLVDQRRRLRHRSRQAHGVLARSDRSGICREAAANDGDPMTRRRRKWEELSDEDPAAGLLNLFDVWIAFAVALLLSMVGYLGVPEMMSATGDVTLVKNPGA